MEKNEIRITLSRLMSDYGMLLILVLLCLFFSWATGKQQHPNGRPGAQQLADRIGEEFEPGTTILVVARDGQDDHDFTEELRRLLVEDGMTVPEVVNGHPIDARRVMNRIVEAGGDVDVIACNHYTSQWSIFENLGDRIPEFGNTEIVTPESYWWPDFLKRDNLLNVANQIVVIAIIAIGMTMVIVTAGIDLSVGSLIALSAVVATILIRDRGGAKDAGPMAIVLCCAGGILVCALVGLFTGGMVTFFRIPPFIATLAIMLVARGLGYIFAKGLTIYEVPKSIQWLGRDTLGGVPNAVLLMIVLYVVAHVVMTYTTFGRYVYAVGGNIEAARLSGVPVRSILISVYAICGALAGLGGIITASQLGSGSPTYGEWFELYVIAAVVVGGASLQGGEGKILGTLIGAFIIAVIQNGMNLTGVESYTQKVVLGLVILGAVLLDMFKKHGWNLFKSGRL